MKKLTFLKFIPAVFSLLIILSCEETPVYEELTSSPEGVQLFISKAERIHTLPTYSLDEMDFTEEDTITFNVGYGGLKLPENSIDINIKVNNQTIDSLNSAREINGENQYFPFPENAYNLSTSTVTIPKGETYSNIVDLIFYPENFEIEKNYLLALEIETPTDYELNPNKKIILFEVQEVIIPEPEPEYYNKENWEIISFTSEEDIGEGENGFAHNIIDGDINSFWHSCWLDCSTEESNYPHEITLDTKEVLNIDGFEFHQRQSGTRAIKELEILVSNDNVQWESLGEFTLLNIVAPQTIELEESKSFRYFKLVTKSAYDGTNFSALGEVSLYILE